MKSVYLLLAPVNAPKSKRSTCSYSSTEFTHCTLHTIFFTMYDDQVGPLPLYMLSYVLTHISEDTPNCCR